MRIELTLFVLLLSLIQPFENHNTLWGNCKISNSEYSIDNQKLLKIIDKKMQKLTNLFGPVLKKDLEIIIYHPKDSILININNPHWNHSLGFTYYSKDKIVIKDPSYAYISNDKFIQVIEHELNHLMINRFTNKIPRWFKEGMAMYVANEIQLNHKLKVIKKLYSKKLIPLQNLNLFNNLNNEDYKLAYAQSALYVESLVNIYGEKIIYDIIEECKTNNDFNDVIYILTNQSIYSLEKKILQFIKNKYYLLKIVNFSNMLFTLMPILLIIGFIIKMSQTKKIKKQWELEEELDNHLN